MSRSVSSARQPAVRAGTVALLSSRIAYGLALLAAPEQVAAKRWLGEDAGRSAAPVPLRGVGAREVALHGLALVAYLRGSAVRPILAASMVGDLADIGATAIAREGLPQGSAPATTAVAGGSLLLTAVVTALVDE
ncbi:MAG TPA: hypothetical protein VFS48_07245 [Solirubrobacterales bacterium]|nr:hypothetical protein [Solirubrobacterales bacterium]